MCRSSNLVAVHDVIADRGAPSELRAIIGLNHAGKTAFLDTPYVGPNRIRIGRSMVWARTAE